MSITNFNGIAGNTPFIDDNGFLILNNVNSQALLSSGVMSGCIITINALDNTKFDISSGVVLIVNNTTYPSTLTQINFAGQTAVAVDLGAGTNTFISIDSTGQLVLTTEFQTFSQTPTVAIVGWVEHKAGTHLEFSLTEPYFVPNLGQQFQQFLESHGGYNIDGNDITPNGANLKLDKSAGQVEDNGIGYEQDINTVNIFSSNQILEIPIKYFYRTGVNTWNNALPNVLLVDPDNYDNGTGLASVTAGYWTIQRVYFYAPFGYLDVYYSQQEYATKDDAISGLFTDTFEENPYFEFDVPLVAIIVKQGATDLSDPLQCEIRTISSTGLGGNPSSSGEVNTLVNRGTVGESLVEPKLGTELGIKGIYNAGTFLSISHSDITKTVNFDANGVTVTNSYNATLIQSASGTGGVANGTNYANGTSISISYPALPVGAVIVSSQVLISYTANNPSYLSELRVRMTPPASVVQTDLAPSIANISGTLTNIILADFTTEDPVGDWLFEFRDTFDDTGVDTNITDITINVNYTLDTNLYDFNGVIQAKKFIGDGSLLTNLPQGVQLVKAYLTQTQAITVTTPNTLTNHVFIIPPTKTLSLQGTLVFTSAATNTGAYYGILVTQPAGADGNAIGSYSIGVSVSSSAVATELRDGDAINVAGGGSLEQGVLGTASTAGNNNGNMILNVVNTSTNVSTVVELRFRSETNGSAVTAQIGTMATALIG